MTSDIRLELVALDVADVATVASFYAALTGWEVSREVDGWTTLRTADGQEVAFQLAPDHVPPRWPGQERPQQFHLDLLVDGCEAAAARAVELGATRLADAPDWVTLADPAGHPFDLCQRNGLGPGVELFAVTIDAPDAPALASFYAALTGMQITHQGPGGTLIAGDGKRLKFQPVNDYHAPRWPDPAHPQQAHLDIIVDDLDTSEARAVRLGAVRQDGGDEWGRTFIDPAGHPFCLAIPGRPEEDED